MSDHVNAVRLRLSLRLRAARQALGLSQGQVADMVLWSHAKYSRVEGGARGTSGSDLLLLMPRLQIPEEEHPLLLAMARQSQQKSAYARHAEILGPGAIEYFDASAVADEVHEFSGPMIPLMLRTEAYQAALIRVQVSKYPNQSGDDWWMLFKQAQGVLETPYRPDMTFVMDESALLRHIGGREVMIDQLAYLSSVAKQRHVQVHVVPFAAGVLSGLLHMSTLLSWREHPEDDMLCVPMPDGEVLICREPRMLSRARADFVELLLHASPASELDSAVNAAMTRL